MIQIIMKVVALMEVIVVVIIIIKMQMMEFVKIQKNLLNTQFHQELHHLMITMFIKINIVKKVLSGILLKKNVVQNVLVHLLILRMS